MTHYKFFAAFILTVFCTVNVAQADNADKPDWSFKSCPDLKIATQKTIREDTVRVEDISFPACDGSVINAYLISPIKAQKKSSAAILFVHWLDEHAPDSNRDEFLQEATALAEKGVVSLLVSTFWSEPNGPYFKRKWENDYSNTLNQTRDLLRALTLLRAQPAVDNKRVAYVGHDYGAAFGAVVAGIDTQLKGLVLMASPAAFPDWYLYGSGSGVPQGADKEKFIAQFKAINPSVMIAKTRAKLFLQYSDNDKFVPREKAEAMHLAAPKNSNFMFYSVDHSMKIDKAIQDRDAWLTKLLNLAD